MSNVGKHTESGPELVDLSSILPAPRLLKGARAAEEYAAEVLRSLGYVEAKATPAGSDGGVDVRADNAIAQVKMEGQLTGRPAVQALHGIAAAEGRTAIFFSLAGYTKQALMWADYAGVVCFEFAFDGSIDVSNQSVKDLITNRGKCSSQAREWLRGKDIFKGVQPRQFADFVGQDHVRLAILSEITDAAKNCDTLNNILVVTPQQGMGGETLSRLTAKTRQVGWADLSGPVSLGKFRSTIRSAETGDMFFVPDIDKWSELGSYCGSCSAF